MELDLKRLSAFLPIVMSLCALAMPLGYVLTLLVLQKPFVHEADEGLAAHLFQILMGGQIPIIFFFLIKYLPVAPKQTFAILGLQIGAGILACLPVYLLGA